MKLCIKIYYEKGVARLTTWTGKYFVQVVTGTESVVQVATCIGFLYKLQLEISGRWSPDPTVRLTVWTQVIGQFFTWLPLYGANQMIIQRYNTVASDKDARRAVFTSIVVSILMIILASTVGLVMYAFYIDCDPWIAGRIQRQDQIVPLFLMEMAGQTPVLPGLFTSAVFAAALSSMSSAINSMSAVCLDDFIKPIFRWKNRPVKDEAAIVLSKVLAFVFGLLSIGLSYVASYLGQTLIQVPITIWGMVGGPLFGVFLLGMVFPFSNSWGASFGLLGSLVLTMWMAIGNILYRNTTEVMPLQSNCSSTTSTFSGNGTMLSTSTEMPMSRQHSSLQQFYNISSTWYALYGTLACIILGIIVSILADVIKKIAGGRYSGNHFTNVKDPELVVPIKETLLLYSPCCSANAENNHDGFKQGNINRGHVNDLTEIAEL